MSYQLRDYQVDCHDSVIEEWKENRSTLGVLPTGGGKTIIFAAIINTIQPKRAMVLAHRKELIYQARDKIKQTTGLECGIEMADSFVNNSLFGKIPVVISTVQTQNSNWGDRKRMGRFNPMDFGVLVIDEVHHCTSQSYRDIINYYSQNPDLKILGVTATPDRSDEEALGQVFQTVAFDYEILDMIHQGWLVPVEQQFVSISGLDFSQMRTTAGDLNGADLTAVMEAESNLQGVAGSLIQIIGDRRTIVFTAGVRQAEMLSEIFNRHKIGMSSWVCGSTPDDDRRILNSKFQDGKIQVVTNCGIFTEGYDNPAVEVIGMARPTKSRALYAQMAGRATRPLPGLVDSFDTAEARREAIASSSKPSCIAQGELVLTNSGLVPIENVTTAMRIWDGVEFVTHCGILFRGVKKVKKYAGLRATDDHKVWTQEGWKAFGICSIEQIPISVTELGGETVREVDRCYRRGGPEQEGSSLCPNGMLLWDTKIQGSDQHIPEECRVQDLWPSGEVTGMAMVEMRKSSASMLKQEEDPQYRNYGGRGICFNFQSASAMALWVQEHLGVHRQLTLDRKNNNGHYEPGNLRWATRSEQQCNKRAKIKPQLGTY